MPQKNVALERAIQIPCAHLAWRCDCQGAAADGQNARLQCGEQRKQCEPKNSHLQRLDIY